MPSAENQFNQFYLERFPKTNHKTLRAWGAADEYLLQYLQEFEFEKNIKVLIVNDQFGALTCSLSKLNPTVWTDSFLSRTAIINNLNLNNLSESSTHFVNQTSQKLESSTKFDLVVLRVPKHNSLLKFQLTTISSHINSNTKVIAAGMSKDIHKSTLKLFEDIIGSTTTSLAKKKARLVFSTAEQKYELETNELISHYRIDSLNLIIKGMPGVFSRDGLDMGARVLLNHLPATRAGQKLIDLGCGTGVLGTAAAQQNPDLELVFCDESWLATESAKLTFESNSEATTDSQQDSDRVTYLTTDCLRGLENRHFDFVLCNPPFHQQNVQTLSIANKMFKQSAEKLKDSGELRVVANRHLKYRPLLNSYFKNVEIISKDPKFVVWLAKNPKVINRI